MSVSLCRRDDGTLLFVGATDAMDRPVDNNGHVISGPADDL